MKSSDWPDSHPDIGYAAYSPDIFESFTLFRVSGNEDDLINNLPE
jgi:hypothetical protein